MKPLKFLELKASEVLAHGLRQFPKKTVGKKRDVKNHSPEELSRW